MKCNAIGGIESMSITEVFGGIHGMPKPYCRTFKISCYSILLEFRTGKTQLSHTLCGMFHMLSLP